MTDLSDYMPVYSHVEEAVRRAYSEPRGNYGKMVSGGVYDGLNCFDKIVQDSMVLRVCREKCTLICQDYFKLCYDYRMDKKELKMLINRLSRIAPPGISREFLLECFERWTERRLCSWQRMTIAKRANSTGISRDILKKQSSDIGAALRSIKEGGLAVVRVHLENDGLL